MMVKNKTQPLADNIYELLLFISKRKPLNDECMITLDKIPKGDSFILVSGHQYSISALAEWFKTSHKHINPMTNLPLEQRDLQRFKDACHEKNIDIGIDNPNKYYASKHCRFFIQISLAAVCTAASLAGIFYAAS